MSRTVKTTKHKLVGVHLDFLSRSLLKELSLELGVSKSEAVNLAIKAADLLMKEHPELAAEYDLKKASKEQRQKAQQRLDGDLESGRIGWSRSYLNRKELIRDRDIGCLRFCQVHEDRLQWRVYDIRQIKAIKLVGTFTTKEPLDIMVDDQTLVDLARAEINLGPYQSILDEYLSDASNRQKLPHGLQASEKYRIKSH